IGGLDTSGGAGLAVDLRVAGALKIRGLPVATCLAIQSDQNFVRLKVLDTADVRAQFDAVKGVGIAAVQIGAFGALELWPEIIEEIKKLKVPVVVDPVLASSSGTSLIAKASTEEIRQFYIERLAPLCALLTPNYNEAMMLSGATGKVSLSDLAKKL